MTEEHAHNPQLQACGQKTQESLSEQLPCLKMLAPANNASLHSSLVSHIAHKEGFAMGCVFFMPARRLLEACTSHERAVVVGLRCSFLSDYPSLSCMQSRDV